MPRSIDKRHISYECGYWRVKITRRHQKAIEGGCFRSLNDAKKRRDELVKAHAIVYQRDGWAWKGSAKRMRLHTRIHRAIDFILRQSRPFRQGDIAHGIGISKTAMSRLMPYLEENGMLLMQDSDGWLSVYRYTPQPLTSVITDHLAPYCS